MAKALAVKLGLRYIENDALIWRPNWVPVPREERLPDFDAATADDGWVLDGNLGRSPEDELVRQRADTFVWLDLPRRTVHWQITKRTLRRIVTREEIFQGNVEPFHRLFTPDSMIWWSIKTYAGRRRSAEYADRVKVRLRSRREVDEWLAQ